MIFYKIAPIALKAVFILVFGLSLTACNAQKVSLSNDTTVPYEQKKLTPQQKDEYLGRLDNYLEKFSDSGTPAEDAAYKKAEEEQKAAKSQNFAGHTQDAGPEPAKIILPSSPEVTSIEHRAQTAIYEDVRKSIDSGNIPVDLTPVSPKITDTDVSPLKLIRNLLCKTEKQCLPSLTPAIEQAIGYYAYREDLKIGGRLINGVQLPKNGYGYYVKTNSQENRWATDHTIYFIVKMAEAIQTQKLAERMIVGDISVFGGGYIAGHLSHQNGLDIDVGFLPAAQVQAPTEQFPKDHIVNNALTSKFGVQENWEFVQTALSTEWPLFVLVHPAVKTKFCQLAKASGDFNKYVKILSLILPEQSHFDHYHFRLRCPISSPQCIPRELLPLDPGC